MRSIDLDAAVLRSARRWLPGGTSLNRIGVALSGGIDSVVLLRALSSLRDVLPIGVRAFHVNHGLSPNADRWGRFCAELCDEAQVELTSTKVVLPEPRTAGLEADARDARYAALATLAADAGTDVIALGHHADDQAETVLLQLLRGGAARGVAAMAEWRAASRLRPALWRPLLGMRRKDIADYAKRHHLRWIDDESNDDVALKRNYLRMHVLPELEQGFRDYRSALARAAAFAAESSDLLEQLAGIDAADAVVRGRIGIARLRAIGPSRSANLLRHLLRNRGIAVPTTDRLAEFVRQTLTGADSARPGLLLDDRFVLCAERGHVAVSAIAIDFHLTWREQSELVLPHGTLSFKTRVGAGFDAARVPSAGFEVHPRAGGERLKLADDRPHRTLKNLMQEAGIAASLRGGWPLVVHDGSVVAIPGIGVSVDWRCLPDERGWTIDWQPLSSAVGENDAASVVRRPL